MHAFYDLEAAGITFDIIQFLLLSEVERVKTNCVSTHVIIVPRENNGCRPEDVGDESQSELRVYNILVGCIQLLESASGFTVCSNRKDAKYYFEKANSKIFPAQYLYLIHI